MGAVLKHVTPAVQAGVTTQEIANRAHKELKKLGGQPAFLGYNGFPSVICISLNDELVHGIPKDHELKDGDIVSLDFGVSYKGMITDSALTTTVGEVPAEVKKLLAGTEEALTHGIKAVKDAVHVGDISAAIQAVLERYGFGIVRDLVGHGVGHAVHEEPNIPNFGKVGDGPQLSSGMTIAIEPMATLGEHAVSLDSDGWTVRSADGSLTAHFEHTVLITPDGAEVLTAR